MPTPAPHTHDIRVMHLTSRADLGGGPQHILTLLHALPSSCRQFVAAPMGEAFSKRFATHARGTCSIPSRRFSITAWLSLVTAIFRWRITLLHSHGRGAGLFSRLAGFVTRRPVIHTHHGLYLERHQGIKRWLFIRIERLLNRLTARIVFVSQSELDACRRAGAFDETKSIIIPNGVNVPPHPRPARTDRLIKLIAITRLEPEKGNDRLIELAHHLRHHFPDFHLNIIGQGPLAEPLAAKVRELGLQEHVTLPGGRNDVPTLLHNSDLYITCSHGEAHSLAMLEAMSHGLPIAASRVRGHTDTVVDGENGLLFDNDDPIAAARTLAAVIQDRATLERLGTCARSHVIEKYSVEVMAARIAQTYQDALAQRHPAPAKDADNATPY